MSAERPRVRAEGPGGPDVKQGARIACLDCRSAKIRCSAPTDGKVPCKRCARHGRECLFEKHRRGRKPGRGNNSNRADLDYSNSPEQSQNPHADRAASYYGAAGSASPAAAAESQDPRDRSGYTSSHQHYSSTSSPLYEHSNHSWRSSSLMSSDPRLSTPPVHGFATSKAQIKHGDDHMSTTSSHRHPLGSSVSYRDGRYFSGQRSPQSSYSGTRDTMHISSPHRRDGTGIQSTSGSLQERHTERDGGSSPRRDISYHAPPFNSIYTSPRYTPSSEQVPSYMPSSAASNMPPPLVSTPGNRSWLDFPTPGSRSALSPSHIMSSSMALPMPSLGSSNSAWPGSAVASPHKRKGAVDYFAGATAASSGARLEGNDEHGAEGENAAAYNKRQKVGGNDRQAEDSDEGGDHETRSSRFDELTSFDDEEHIDQLDEDMVNAGHEDDVLSTPLRLLAHASDAAASLKSTHGYDSSAQTGQRSVRMGAATMGLVSPPTPRLPAVRSWLDNKPRLPTLVPTLHRPGSLLPTLISSAHRRDQQRMMSIRTTGNLPSLSRTRLFDKSPMGAGPFPAVAPPNLGMLGRSRSYTAAETSSIPIQVDGRSGEIVNPSPEYIAAASTVTQDERRAEILGVRVDADGKAVEDISRILEASESITSSTLDPDAWEYRDGRVRARKSISIGAPTSLSGGEDGSAKRVSENGSIGESRKTFDISASNAVSKADIRASSEVYTKPADLPFSKPRPSFSAGAAPRRWHAVQRRASKLPQASLDDASTDSSDTESDASEALGAAHRDFFSMSIFHSKMDNEEDLDPVTTGILTLRELEKLFDMFFARINPVLTLFDPFLHSVTYVRARSAMLTTVIAALAARLSETERDAKLAVELEHHWRHNLLPESILGGYKSVELSQAFAVLSLYHKPTNRLSEDRSWQYLGLAIRIATEIGINRLTQPSLEVKDNEQVARRMRNRSRLWISLFLADRALSLQTGRQTTLTEDGLLASADMWHREPFSLPSDARLVSLLKLKRIVSMACQAHDAIIATTKSDLHDNKSTSVAALYQWQEAIKSLNFARIQANTEIDRWQDVWCAESLDESNDGIRTLAISSFLQQWRPRAQVDNLYARLHLNSLNLETIERLHRLMIAASESARRTDPDKEAKDAESTAENGEDGKVSNAGMPGVPFEKTLDEVARTIDRISHDCWEVSVRVLDIFNSEIDKDILSSAPNALAIKIIYASLAAIRLSSSGSNEQRPWASPDHILPKCRSVADRLIEAGRTPTHRNGAAAPFGLYLKGIVSSWCNASKENAAEAAKNATSNEGAGTKGTGMSRKPIASVSTLEAAMVGSDAIESAVEEAAKAVPPIVSAAAVSEAEPTAAPLAPVASSTLQKGLVTPNAVKAPSQVQVTAPHTVGDEIWGTSNTRRTRTASANLGNANGTANGSLSRNTNPEDLDRMWDYLTTYTDTASSFPLSLWQQQATGSNGAQSMLATGVNGIQSNSFDADAILDTAIVPETPVTTAAGVAINNVAMQQDGSAQPDASTAGNGLTSVSLS